MILDQCEELFIKKFEPVLCTDKFISTGLFMCKTCKIVRSDKVEAHKCCEVINYKPFDYCTGLPLE